MAENTPKKSKAFSNDSGAAEYLSEALNRDEDAAEYINWLEARVEQLEKDAGRALGCLNHEPILLLAARWILREALSGEHQKEEGDANS